MIVRTAIAVVLFATMSLAAQVPPEPEAVLPSLPDIDVRPLQDSPAEPAPATDRELEVFAKSAARVGTNTDATGTNGELMLDGASDVVLKVFTGPIRFLTNTGTERMRIASDGGVGISTTNTSLGRLVVQHGVDNSKAVFVTHQPAFELGSPTQNDYGLWVQAHENVHAGAANPGYIYGQYMNALATGPGSLGATIGAAIEAGTSGAGAAGGTVTSAIGLRLSLLAAAGSTITNGYGVLISDVPATNDYGLYQTGTNDDNYFAGRVGIGTTAPNRKLMVISSETGGAFLAQQTTTYTANANADETSGVTAMYTTVNTGVTKSGTAIGHRGASWLQGAGTLDGAYGLYGEVGVLPGHSGTITNGYGFYALVQKNNGSMVNGYGLYIADVAATNSWGVYQTASDDRNYFAGNVLIGTTSSPTGAKLEVAGTIHATGDIIAQGGVIGAVYQDMAEWVPASSDMVPGTVVVLNHDRTNEVMPSHSAYDTSVAGVVSAQPGILLGVAGDSKEQIATTGRVKVRVDASKGPVRVGDLLVTSDVPGTAMRSEAMEINGRRFHQPGTIIGKALEPLDTGVGDILVLLSLQ